MTKKKAPTAQPLLPWSGAVKQTTAFVVPSEVPRFKCYQCNTYFHNKKDFDGHSCK